MHNHSLTTAVLDEALSTPTSTIVSYHPTIFKPLASLTLSNPLQTSLLKCAAHGISVYSPHTACDAVWGGVNDWLAEGVMGGAMKGEDGQVGILGKAKVDPYGVEEGGEGRIVRLSQPIEMADLESRIKKHLGLSNSTYLRSSPFRSCSSGINSSNISCHIISYHIISQSKWVAQALHPQKKVQSIAICAGSGGSMLLGQDADVYFTGEMSHVCFVTLLPFNRCCLLSAVMLLSIFFINSTKFWQRWQQANMSYCVRPFALLISISILSCLLDDTDG